MKKERLDALLTARGFFESRARAQAAIMAGQVLVNEQKIDKPGTQVPEEAAIRLLCSGGTGVGADCHMEGIVTAALEAEVHIV